MQFRVGHLGHPAFRRITSAAIREPSAKFEPRKPRGGASAPARWKRATLPGYAMKASGGERGNRTPAAGAGIGFQDRRITALPSLQIYFVRILDLDVQASAPGRLRTCDPQLRKLMLCSPELRMHGSPLTNPLCGFAALGFEPNCSAFRTEWRPAPGLQWLTRDSNPDSGGFKPLPSTNWGSEPDRGLPSPRGLGQPPE